MQKKFLCDDLKPNFANTTHITILAFFFAYLGLNYVGQQLTHIFLLDCKN
jgi:hypothetical protein